MLSRCFLPLLLCICFAAAKSQPGKATKADSTKTAKAKQYTEPVFNYHITPPAKWAMYDTVLNGLRIRILKAPKSLSSDNPIVNVLIANMEGKNIEEFTASNIKYLKTNMAGISILKKGSIDTLHNGQWFTYTKMQNGVLREMINYIIPVNGLAYMITCGTNPGTLKKYRPVFDKIAKSFKA